VKVKDNECQDAPREAPHGWLESAVVSAYESYSSELFAYATAIIHQHDAALDAVQEAFLRYFVELSYGRTVEHPRAWLYRVVRNYLLDRIGSAAAQRESPLPVGDRFSEPAPGPDVILQHAQLARSLVSLLSPREMECVRLRAENLSYEEIAAILKVRPGTVSALLTRAHKKLSGSGDDKYTLRHLTIAALHFLFQSGGGHSS
jgi:RNA polymerase sigma-70 factor (ECF subfamily)